MACGSLDWLKQRRDKTQAIIEAIEDALEQLSLDGVQSYQLNTGQNESRVSKINVPELEKRVDSLYSRLCRLTEQINNIENGLGSGGVSQVVPAW